MQIESKKKILIAIPSMHGGGAERVILTLLKYFDRDFFDLHLALVSKKGEYLSEIPKDIIIHDLRSKRVLRSFIPLYRLCRRLKPQVILSTLDHLNFLLLFLKPFLPSNVKLIVRGGNTVSNLLQEFKSPLIWTFLYRKLYPKADKIITQSQYMTKDLVENFSIPKNKILAIYNPVDVRYIEKKSIQGINPYKAYGKGPHIISIGRLDHQKQHNILIQSFECLLREKPNAHLWILGTGLLKEKLESFCKELGIIDKVHFVGFQKNPYLWLKHSDLFVLCSQYEGLPNVLLEALACQCPIVVTEHPGGTKEIMEITDLTDRWVKDLIWEEKWFFNLSETIRFKIDRNFGINQIVKQYEKVLIDAINQH
jgi:glycosyltransferase involved in cell wall biosynthesis